VSAERFVGTVLKEFAAALQPLADGISSPEALAGLLSELGWSLPGQASTASVSSVFTAVGEGLSALETAAGAVQEALEGDDAGGELAAALKELVPAIQQLVTKLHALEGTDPSTLLAPFDQPDFWQSAPGRPSFPEELLGYLVYRYLEERLPVVFAILTLLGVLDRRAVAPTTPGRLPYERRSVRWDLLPAIVAKPGSLPATVYRWGGTFDHERAITNLGSLLAAFEVGAAVAQDDPALDDYYDADAPARDTIATVRAPVVWMPFDNGTTLGQARLELAVVPIPPAGQRTAEPAGLAVFPDISAQIAAAIALTESVELEVGGAFAGAIVRAEIRPDGAGVGVSPPSAKGSGKVALQAQPAKPWILLGTRGSPRLELAQGHVSLRAEIDPAGLEVLIDAGADAARLVLDFGEGDGFLKSLFGGKPQAFDLSCGLVWSSRNGVRFNGRVGLEIEIGVHQSILGVVDIETVHVGLTAGAGSAGAAASLMLALTGGAKLGPVAASIERVGLRAELTPAPASAPGNLGPLQLTFAFKPPDGLGVVVDAGPVTGGGFISFDHVNRRYAGILQLRVGTFLAITVIGLLDTRLPDGSEGFSFLLIVSAKFSPIQLGFGFTLNGVGGLAGINRTIVVEALQAGVRSRSVDNILFPQDPVRDAPQIISDLRTIFPPAAGRYVFGPMAIIGYGPTALLEAELGIILELPAPVRIILLGQLNAALPDKKAPIVELHLDVLGVLDFGAKLLSIDASLHDSRIAAFNVFGDMAMRLSWGEQPNFALSVGGFHPAFQAPPDFPQLRRLTIALGAGENPRLSLQSYLAVTSNTFQVGARAELYAEAAGFNVYGWIGFDALFIFSPFSFQTRFSAGFALRRGEAVIAGIHLDASLSGPSPFHARGSASLSILFFEITVDFDATFGEEQRVAVAAGDPWEALQAAMEDRRNWSATLPPAAFQVVSVTSPTGAGAEPVLIDPVGGLTLRQKAVPLNRTLTKFGEGRLASPQRFTVPLDQVKVGGAAVPAPTFVRDQFAPAQFEQMSDAQKLSRPSFEQMDAGLTVASDAVAFTMGGGVRGLDATYETVTINAARQPPKPVVGTYVVSFAHQLSVLQRAAAARSALLTTGLERFAPPAGSKPAVQLAEETFLVVDVDHLQARTDVLPRPTTKGAAFEALDAWLASRPEDRGRLQVVPAPELEAVG
jgi:hypothetical protein